MGPVSCDRLTFLCSIPPGIWFVMDVDPPPLKRIYLYGGLEIEDNADHKLEVEILLVQGGRFQCGLPSAPHQHKFELVLRGDHMTQDQPLPDGPNLGAKALGVFGFADMVGKDVGQTWTKLAATAAAGTNPLQVPNVFSSAKDHEIASDVEVLSFSYCFQLSSSVSWEVGSEVVVSSKLRTHYDNNDRILRQYSLLIG